MDTHSARVCTHSCFSLSQEVLSRVIIRLLLCIVQSEKKREEEEEDEGEERLG